MAKLLTLNVKGLNSNTKRRLLLTELRSARADIVFIQETHFDRDGNFAFVRKDYPTALMASSVSKKVGVAILVRDVCPFQVSNTHVDPQGRYLIVQGSLRGVPITLCNIYAPNTLQIRFLNKVLSRLACLPPAALILGGDFNMVFSEVRDRLAPDGKSPPAALQSLSRSFRQAIQAHSLFDCGE